MQYPSSMISSNLSHETFVTEKKYLDTPDTEFETIKYDNYEYIKQGKGESFTKIINAREPIKICIFAQPKKDKHGKIIDSTRGMIPRILMQLLAARKAAKKKMSAEADPFKKGLLNSLQNAYKITCNSVYGQTGASTSAICLKEIAASTTATGRKSLLTARDYIFKTYGATPVYGDTVRFIYDSGLF